MMQPRPQIFVLLLAVFMAPMALADKLPSFLYFEMGGGQSQSPGEQSYLRRHTQIAALAVGTGLRKDVPFYLALTGQTFQIPSIATQGQIGLNQKIDHNGLGLGLRTGFNWSYLRFWGEFIIGRMTSTYSLTKQNQTTVDPIDTVKPDPPPPEEFSTVRQSYIAPGAGMGVNIYSSYEARIDFNLTANRVQPNLNWRDDFGYGQIWIYGANLSLTVYNAIKLRAENF